MAAPISRKYVMRISTAQRVAIIDHGLKTCAVNEDNRKYYHGGFRKMAADMNAKFAGTEWAGVFTENNCRRAWHDDPRLGPTKAPPEPRPTPEPEPTPEPTPEIVLMPVSKPEVHVTTGQVTQALRGLQLDLAEHRKDFAEHRKAMADNIEDLYTRMQATFNLVLRLAKAWNVDVSNG